MSDENSDEAASEERRKALAITTAKDPESIMVVDDDPIIARLLEIELVSAGYEVQLAASGEEAIAAAQNERPELILLDVMMPGLDGFEVARRLRADPRTVATSIIMLTAAGLSANRLEGLNAGADDYIVKPFDTPELLARVKGVLRRAKEWKAQSPLTGLPGYVRIEEEIDRRIDENIPFAVLYADLDNFKAFNEYYGFARGDEVLRSTGNGLKKITQEDGGDGSFIGHVGGDDFVIVAVPEAVATLGDRIVAEFDAMAPSFYDEADLARGFIEVENRRGDMQRFQVLSVSIGVASSERRTFSHYAEVVAVAAEMKEFTKRTPGSVWAVDRRTT